MHMNTLLIRQACCHSDLTSSLSLYRVKKQQWFLQKEKTATTKSWGEFASFLLFSFILCPVFLVGKPLEDKEVQEETFSYSCGIDSFWIVLYNPGQAEIWHFTNKIAVDKNIASRKVPVNVSHVGQISHSSSNSSQHSY